MTGIDLLARPPARDAGTRFAQRQSRALPVERITFAHTSASIFSDSASCCGLEHQIEPSARQIDDCELIAFIGHVQLLHAGSRSEPACAVSGHPCRAWSGRRSGIH